MEGSKAKRVESERSRRKCLLIFRNRQGAKGKKARKTDCDPGINAKCGRQEFWSPCSPMYHERYSSMVSLRINFNSQAAATGLDFNS